MQNGDIENKLKEILKKVTTQAASVIETEAVKSVKKNFEVGGRPVKWEPSVKSKKNAGTKTLVVSGAMSETTSETIDVSTGVAIILRPGVNARAYSRIHQEGGTIQRSPRSIRFRNNKSGRTIFAKNSHKRITKETISKAYEIKIPARPHLVVPNEDFQNIINAVVAAVKI